MTDPNKEPKKTTSQPTGDPPPEEGKVTAGTLRQMIREEITGIADKLFPKTTSTQDNPGGSATPQGSQQQQAADVKSEVARALQSLKTKEDRDARDAKVDKMLAEYEQAKVNPQKPPVERRKVHDIMGWGKND